jgi:hypothetical protein
MAEVRLTTWRGIPVLVTARDPAGEVTVPLGPGFQDLVDRVAVQAGRTDADDYLAGWGVEEVPARPGPAAAVAQAVAGELEAHLDALRARHLGSGPGPDAAGQPPGAG